MASQTTGAEEGWYEGPVPAASAPEPKTLLPLPKDVALEPTRLMQVPTTQVLGKGQYVVSFHEVSLGLDDNIQIYLSLWPEQRSGRQLLGVKFALREDIAMGVGITGEDNMFGLYGVKAFPGKEKSLAYGIGNLMIGNNYEIDAGTGYEMHLSGLVKLMGEGICKVIIDDSVAKIDFDLSVGIRYMWPVNKPLKLDLGMNLINMKNLVTNTGNNWYRLIYIDVSYSSEIR